MAAPSQSIQVEGLHELGKALRQIDKDLRTDLMRELRAIGNRVRDQARSNASSRSKTGREVKGIKTSAKSGKRTMGVSVVSKGVNPANGYRYPKRHEYEGGARTPGKKGSLPGPRAVVNPAVEKLRARSERDIEKLLDSVLRGF